mgnify:CR=1 FL=1|jgi:hypothetical protein
MGVKIEREMVVTSLTSSKIMLALEVAIIVVIAVIAIWG